jgi:hypothetical protein
MEMLSVMDRWFEPVQPTQRYRREDFIILLLILVAGTWLRFWHLGNVGLHGDEDIMGLAVRGLVEQGTPVLPSGMYYARALAHTYLLAGSALLFGETEWALRLPSAIVGSLCGLLAFFLGKRFLDPKLNLAFVALMTFLPAMIDISLTARMYIFLVTGMVAFSVLVFRWERTQSPTDLVWAFLVWLVSVHFHPLSIFSAPLFLFPGLANRSRKQLLQGSFAVVSSVVVTDLLGSAVDRITYPDESEKLELPETSAVDPLELVFQGHSRLAISFAIAAALAVLLFGILRNERWRTVLPATLFFSIGAASCVLLHYHVGAIALLIGAVLWLRARIGRSDRLLMIVAAIGLLAVAQFYLLHISGQYPGRTIIGAFVGAPSIWPTLRFMAFSPGAVVIAILALSLATYRLAQGHRIPVYFMFFAIAVWAPLIGMGLFRWDVALRYTLGMLPFLLLFALAAVPYVLRSTSMAARVRRFPVATMAGAVVLVILLVNPAAMLQAARNDYTDHPDHKGAAEFIREITPAPAYIIIAEDSINLTYYLGKVDYRVQNFVRAKKHSVLKDGVLYGQYTDTPVIGSGRQFEMILDRATTGNIYIIGSGEFHESQLRSNRANGISEVLESDRLEVIYVGRDRKTKVWKPRRQVND